MLAEDAWLALVEALVLDEEVEVVERAVIVDCENVVVVEVVLEPELEGRALPDVTAMANGSKGKVATSTLR